MATDGRMKKRVKKKKLNAKSKKLKAKDVQLLDLQHYGGINIQKELQAMKEVIHPEEEKKMPEKPSMKQSSPVQT